MWLLTLDGKVGTFNPKNFTYSPAFIQSKYSNPVITFQLQQKLIADEYGNIFLLFPGKSILTYDKTSNEFSEENNFFQSEPDWTIMDFAQQPGTKNYWLCLGEGGFAIYNAEHGILSHALNNSEQHGLVAHYYPGTRPYKIFFDSKGRIWHVSMEEGLPFLYAYNTAKGEPLLERYGFSEQVGRYHEVNDFLEQQDGSIWISGVHILAKFLEQEKEFQQVYNGYMGEQSIDFVVITSIHEDRERNIWLGTGNNGIYRFNPSEEFFHSISHISKLRGNVGSGGPIDFIHDLDGSILTAVWGDRLYRYDNNMNPIPLGIKGYPEDKITPVVAFCKSKRGQHIWMATADGVFKYDQKNRTMAFHHFPNLQSRIRDLAEDRDGGLWLGLQEHGLYSWDPEKGENGLQRFNGLPTGRIHNIKVDQQGMVWVATFGSGAFVINPESKEVVHQFHPNAPEELRLPESYVSAILHYNDSLSLLATRSHILKFNRNNQSLKKLTSSNTVSGVVQSIERDSDGFIWFSTTSGLIRYSMAKNVFLKFNRKDGIVNDYFIIGASHTLPDGRMIFGASFSMVCFNPEDVRISTEYPKVHITDFKIMNRSVPVDSLLGLKTINLAADQNSIAVDLSTMSHVTVYVVRYILEGLDTEWKILDKNFQLDYSYLPAGDYTLKIVPINSEGLEASKPLLLNIMVAPPFWRTWWFLSLLTLLLVMLLYFLDKARMQRKEALQKMRTEIAANLHQEVNTALHNINILSEMAKKKAVSDPEKSSQFIEQIHNKSHNMIFALDDMLWSIAPENDNMQKTIERMTEYIEAMNNRHNLGMTMLVDKGVKDLKLNMQLRYEAFILFKETVKALMTAKASRFNIHVTKEKSHLLYSIELNNSCCDLEELQHLEHRQDMAKRLSVLGASLKIKMQQSHSLTELRIPLLA
jgi:ligand-binding sensor domain-containing protein